LGAYSGTHKIGAAAVVGRHILSELGRSDYGRVSQSRIDGERKRVIVWAQFERQGFVVLSQLVRNLNICALTVLHLICDGLLPIHVAGRSLNQQAAIRLRDHVIRALHAERYLRDIRLRSQLQVVLQFAMVAVIDEIYALINRVVTDASVILDAPKPMRLIANEIVRASGEFVFASGFRLVAGA